MKPSRGLVRILAVMMSFVLTSSVQTNAHTYCTGVMDLRSKVNAAHVPTTGNADLRRTIFEAGVRDDVDPRLLAAVIWQESRYKAEAESHVGALGLMQLMPAAAQRFGCEDREDIEANVTAGTKYLRWLLKRFDGNVTLALAAYNAGEGNVDKHEGVPPYEQMKATAKGGITALESGGFGMVKITQSVTVSSEGEYNKLIITDSISVEKPGMLARIPANNVLTGKVPVSLGDNPKIEVSGMGRVEVLTVSRSDGREVQHKRIYYAPKLNPHRVGKYRQPSSPAAELLPVGAEFTFWAGEGDDATPISDKVTITVQPNGNLPVTLQLKESVASAK